MNEREKKAYLLKKYNFRIGRQDDLDKITDLDDEIMAIDLELRNIDRIERSLIRSGKMTREQILEGQLRGWKEVYRREVEKTIRG